MLEFTNYLSVLLLRKVYDHEITTCFLLIISGTSPSISSVPAQTITMEMATMLMKNLDGGKVPETWTGGLNTTYRYGQSESSKLKQT